MQETGYTPKELLFNEAGRDKLFSGIEKISSAVKSTLGPSGQTVLIESPNHTHGITVTKDGVTVAKSVDLIDATENLAVRIMKQAADRTATQAGDGTTTAIVLTEALVNAGKSVDFGTENKTQVLRDLVKETEKVVGNLRKQSRKINSSYNKLHSVATISSNNDKDLGKVIADVYSNVGKDGIVTVDRSKTADTYYEYTKGLKVDRGYSSPLFINDQKRDECVMEDVHILVSDATIDNILNIENVLKPIIQDRKKLLIIAEVSQNVLNTLAANVMKSGLKICVVQPPSFGYKQHELMSDIAVSVGATYFSEKTGDDLSLMNIQDLGHCDKIVVGKDTTVIIKDEEDSEEVKERVRQLRAAQDEAERKQDKDFISERIASLSGGVGVVYVGGHTDLEQKELYDRVDDAVCAVRSALEEGILPGGGLALYKQSLLIEPTTTAKRLLKEALQAPLKQIYLNAGLEYSEYENALTDGSKPKSYGLDVKSGKQGDLFTMGIIDPLKVTRSALQNAVSVASTLLSTNAIITMARSYDQK
jgi:chaperonin GroEL